MTSNRSGIHDPSNTERQSVEYQIEGFQWLCHLEERGRGRLLARYGVRYYLSNKSERTGEAFTNATRLTCCTNGKLD